VIAQRAPAPASRAVETFVSWRAKKNIWRTVASLPTDLARLSSEPSQNDHRGKAGRHRVCWEDAGWLNAKTPFRKAPPGDTACAVPQCLPTLALARWRIKQRSHINGQCGNTGRPFSLPVEPLRPRVTFRNPVNGATVTISKDAAFLLTFIFGCFYLAYKEAWLHAGIAALIAIVTGPLWLIFWFVYAFFAYRIIVDSYRRKG
jgi:hypothetical protein